MGRESSGVKRAGADHVVVPSPLPGVGDEGRYKLASSRLAAWRLVLVVLVIVPLVVRRDNILPNTSDASTKVSTALMAVGDTTGPVVNTAAAMALLPVLGRTLRFSACEEEDGKCQRDAEGEGEQYLAFVFLQLAVSRRPPPARPAPVVKAKDGAAMRPSIARE